MSQKALTKKQQEAAKAMSKKIMRMPQTLKYYRCVTSDKDFLTLSDAAEYAGIKTTRVLRLAAENNKYCGVHPTNGIKLKWTIKTERVREKQFKSLKAAATHMLFLGKPLETLQQSISMCANGHRKTAYGYEWRYVDGEN